VRVVNIVAIAKVKGFFNLTLLAERVSETEFSPEMRWLKMRLKPEDYYVAFYKSGKFLITGVKDFDLIAQIVNRVLARLVEAGIDADLESVTIHNIVLVDEVAINASLENIVRSLGDVQVSYEPEQFPGLLYKDDDGISFTLFSTGKVIVTGITDIGAAKRNIEEFKALVAR
jgi:transcription initiation factor TFIID TATA-box-binding protein